MTIVQTVEIIHPERAKESPLPLELAGSQPQTIYVRRRHHLLGKPQVGLSETPTSTIFLGGIKCINPHGEDGDNYNTKILTFTAIDDTFDMECDLPCMTEPFLMCVPSVGFKAVYDVQFSWENAGSATIQLVVAPNEPLIDLPTDFLVLENNNPQDIFVHLFKSGTILQWIGFSLTPDDIDIKRAIAWRIQPGPSNAKVLTLILPPECNDIGTDLLRSTVVNNRVVLNVPRCSVGVEYHFDVDKLANPKQGIDPKIKPIPPTDP